MGVVEATGVEDLDKVSRKQELETERKEGLLLLDPPLFVSAVRKGETESIVGQDVLADGFLTGSPMRNEREILGKSLLDSLDKDGVAETSRLARDSVDFLEDGHAVDGCVLKLLQGHLSCWGVGVQREQVLERISFGSKKRLL